MTTVEQKPAPFICPECGLTKEPMPHPIKSGAWWEHRSCPECGERVRIARELTKTLKTIDRMSDSIDSVLLGRGLTPNLLLAQIEQVPEKLQRALASLDGGFVFGPIGTGKSFLFSALMRKSAMDMIAYARTVGVVPEFGRLPFFVNVSNLLWRLRSASIGKGENGESEVDVVNIFVNYPSLILDDIGVRRSSEFVEDCLYDIVNGRYNFLRPTFFTSNYSLRELSARVEPRTVSRIAGMTAGRVIYLGGADRRLIQTNNLEGEL